jgi:hypothetical protein
MSCEFEDKIFKVNGQHFEQLAIEMFLFQSKENPVYSQFVSALNINPSAVKSLGDIPFLPIQAFKTHMVQTTSFEPWGYFESSGTTQTIQSRHYIRDLEIYRSSFTKGFRLFYGNPGDWVIIGLLPSYLERQNSSLVMMVDELIRMSGKPESGFYLDEHDRLASVLAKLEQQQQKTLLIGVAFGLLDFAEKYPMQLQYTVVMETGGMKGRKKELIRDELHAILKKGFGTDRVHSEYGMTELFSQAYATSDGFFETPPWMKVMVRQEDDPLQVCAGAGTAITGLINVIDLANIYSCAFIATEDVGRIHSDGRFEVLGRVDNSDIRGCSLLLL